MLDITEQDSKFYVSDKYDGCFADRNGNMCQLEEFDSQEEADEFVCSIMLKEYNRCNDENLRHGMILGVENEPKNR